MSADVCYFKSFLRTLKLVYNVEAVSAIVRQPCGGWGFDAVSSQSRRRRHTEWDRRVRDVQRSFVSKLSTLRADKSSFPAIRMPVKARETSPCKDYLVGVQDVSIP